MKQVAQFAIDYWQYLDSDGRPLDELPGFARDPDEMIAMYRALWSTRLFDRKAIVLQRTGQLGTYASPLGQEAIGVGVGYAMSSGDVLVPGYRDQAAQFVRGVRMTDILLYWGGDERGMDFAVAREDFPISIPVGSHACHAVGIAYALQLRKEPRAAVCTLGDGATSKGDFYESLNAAGVWRLPLVFVVNNNQWAISVRRSAQSAAQTLAQKAIAGGVRGEQVDGNDLVAVRSRLEEALALARAGEGPTLIEALSYRMGDHTTADDARRYRSQAELEAQAGFDPILRMRAWMTSAEYWSDRQEEALHLELSAQVEAAVREYLRMSPQDRQSMFDHLYETLPAAYVSQREELADTAAEAEEPYLKAGTYDG
ncbi:MAG: pyruvate dehydrogenase (acetyl-transferring) E1 component subunit alpha [Pseudomonadota bacterium]|nr:pyruvate dehydrogenase (acetyl-transferring) E1 component subunit alpha [Pseudomonadota bacterium]